MAKSQQTWNKKEREKKKQKDKQEKAEKMQERKASGGGTKRMEDMMAYIDENGNIVDTPPDPSKRKEYKIEDIVIGVPKHEPLDPADALRRGVVSFFNESKGFGFIRDLQTGESIFVHVNGLIDAVSENSRVLFETEKGPRGLNAVRVKLDS